MNMVSLLYHRFSEAVNNDNTVFQSNRQITREQDTETSFFAVVTLKLTPRHWYTTLTLT